MNGDLIPTVDKIYDYNQLRNNFIWENIDNSDSTLTHRHLLDEHLDQLLHLKC